MKSCVYFLLYKGKVVYIGHTSSLQIRIKSHKRSAKDFDTVKYIETDYFVGSKIERFLIAYFKPKHNTRIDWKNFEIKEYDINTDIKKYIKYKEPDIL